MPDTEDNNDFVVNRCDEAEAEINQDAQEQPVVAESKDDDEFDLSDITATPKEKSREDIIAEAEQAAFGA